MAYTALMTDLLLNWVDANKKQEYPNGGLRGKLSWSRQTPKKEPFQQLKDDNVSTEHEENSNCIDHGDQLLACVPQTVCQRPERLPHWKRNN